MTPLSRSAQDPARSPPVRTSGCTTGAALASHRGREVCLLLAVLVVAAGAGCLIPQDVDKTHVNLPPRIVIESLPSQYIVPFLTLTRATRDVGCTCELTLSIPAVAEEDPSISLEGRWFIDYDKSLPATQRQAATSPLKGTFDSTATVRAPGPSFTVSPDALGGDGFHTVDVVIADQQGFLPSDDPSALLPNRTVSADYAAATFRFFVKVVTDTDLPQCPVIPPAITRSCPQGGNR